MGRPMLLLLLLAGGLGAAWDEADVERYSRAIELAQAGSMPDTAVTIDRYGCSHRAYVDPVGLWYQSDEPWPGRRDEWTVPLLVSPGPARSPVTLVVQDRHGAERSSMLVLAWQQECGDETLVLCRMRRLVQPFWEWTEVLDVTPPR